MAAMRLEQVQRFILAKKIFCGYGHFKIYDGEVGEDVTSIHNFALSQVFHNYSLT